MIGITGSIGSGKSTVGRFLEEEGIPVIDSDRVVHDLFETNTEVKEAIRARFGNAVMATENGAEKVDRKKLGNIVFSDPASRKALEAIVHPATIKACRERIEEKSDNDVVAVLVPLLFEAGLEKQYDAIWTVFADENTLKQRIRERDKLSEAEIENRFAAQLPQEEKKARATETIDNSGTKEATREQVSTLLRKLKQHD